MRQLLSTSLDSAALPKRWRFVAELPHHPLGKSNIAALRALFAEETAL
jgi:acyl-coenzyme A synthetase/AMP-(fatty) acid ligase